MMIEIGKIGEKCVKVGYYTFMCYENGSVDPGLAYGEHEIAMHIGGVFPKIKSCYKNVV